MMNRYLLLVTMAAFTTMNFASPAQAADGPIRWNLTPAARYDDNIGLAPDSSSERDVITLTMAGGLSWAPIQTATDEVAVSAGLFYDAVQELEDLSNYGATAGVSYTHQFGSNFGAPWIKVSLDGVFREYEDSEVRDGYSGDAKLAFGKRFGPKFEASVGVRYQIRESTEDNPEGSQGPGPIIPTIADTNSDEVFDQERDGAFLRLDFSPTPRTAIFFEYNYFSGDVASTADFTMFPGGLQFDRARDFAFEEGSRYVVYKIDADQDVYSLGLTRELSERLSIELGSSFLDADAEAGNTYENLIFTAALSLTF